MSDLDILNIQEMRDRLEQIFLKLDILFKQVGPQIKEIGDLRAEAKLLYEELLKRGVIKTETFNKNVPTNSE